MRPSEQLRDRCSDVGEAFGVDHSRLSRPDDPHHGGHRLGFDKLNLQLVVLIWLDARGVVG